MRWNGGVRGVTNSSLRCWRSRGAQLAVLAGAGHISHVSVSVCTRSRYPLLHMDVAVWLLVARGAVGKVQICICRRCGVAARDPVSAAPGATCRNRGAAIELEAVF